MKFDPHGACDPGTERSHPDLGPRCLEIPPDSTGSSGQIPCWGALREPPAAMRLSGCRAPSFSLAGACREYSKSWRICATLEPLTGWPLVASAWARVTQRLRRPPGRRIRALGSTPASTTQAARIVHGSALPVPAGSPRLDIVLDQATQLSLELDHDAPLVLAVE